MQATRNKGQNPSASKDGESTRDVEEKEEELKEGAKRGDERDKEGERKRRPGWRRQ